jgi:uncharacterized protein YpmB
MKTDKKGFLMNIVLIILVIILAGALIYVTLGKKPEKTPETSVTQNTIPKQESKTTIPEEYVKKTQDSANQATFVFAIPVKKQDITGANIKHCVVSASAGAQAGGIEPECTETTSVNSFFLKYDDNTRTLVISDPTPGEWGHESGPFRIGCAACFSTIEFSHIHTMDGRLLPKKIVTVY